MTRIIKISAIVLSVLALLLMLLAAKLIFTPKPKVTTVVLEDQATQQSVEAIVVPTYPVVVASQPLTAGARIQSTDLTMAHWPVQLQLGFDSPDKVVGHFLRMSLQAGEPLLTTAFKRGISSYLSDNERAVTIPVDENTGAAHRITPGDHVDIFFALDKAGEVEQTQVRLLLSAIRVLAYGAESIDGPEAVPDDVQRRSTPLAPRTAMLAVPLAQVNELLIASRNGNLRLVLRAEGDMAVPDAELFKGWQPVRVARQDIPKSEAERLSSPINKAYAGLSLGQVAVSDSVPVRPTSPRITHSATTGGIQVIRGGQSTQVHY